MFFSLEQRLGFLDSARESQKKSLKYFTESIDKDTSKLRELLYQCWCLEDYKVLEKTNNNLNAFIDILAKLAGEPTSEFTKVIRDIEHYNRTLEVKDTLGIGLNADIICGAAKVNRDVFEAIQKQIIRAKSEGLVIREEMIRYHFSQETFVFADRLIKVVANSISSTSLLPRTAKMFGKEIKFHVHDVMYKLRSHDREILQNETSTIIKEIVPLLLENGYKLGIMVDADDEPTLLPWNEYQVEKPCMLQTFRQVADSAEDIYLEIESVECSGNTGTLVEREFPDQVFIDFGFSTNLFNKEECNNFVFSRPDIHKKNWARFLAN